MTTPIKPSLPRYIKVEKAILTDPWYSSRMSGSRKDVLVARPDGTQQAFNAEVVAITHYLCGRGNDPLGMGRDHISSDGGHVFNSANDWKKYAVVAAPAAVEPIAAKAAKAKRVKTEKPKAETKAPVEPKLKPKPKLESKPKLEPEAKAEQPKPQPKPQPKVEAKPTPKAPEPAPEPVAPEPQPTVVLQGAVRQPTTSHLPLIAAVSIVTLLMSAEQLALVNDRCPNYDRRNRALSDLIKEYSRYAKMPKSGAKENQSNSGD